MLYSFARVSAVLGMRRQDYFRQESRGWLRLHEKGGKRHDVPAHHRAAAALDDYLAAAELDEAKAALFQSVDPAGRRLTGRPLSRRLVLAMIKQRALAADLPASTCCHTFRATGISPNSTAPVVMALTNSAMNITTYRNASRGRVETAGRGTGIGDSISANPASARLREQFILGVWGAMERKVRLATAVSGVSERPELAPSDRFRYGERVASQQVDVLVAER